MTPRKHRHWSLVASFVAIILLWGLVGSTDRGGWMITAWLAGISAATYGLASLVFPDVASALVTGWAIAAVARGAGYVALILRRQSLLKKSVDAPVRAVSSEAESP